MHILLRYFREDSKINFTEIIDGYIYKLKKYDFAEADIQILEKIKENYLHLRI
jgi:hypothetical protein